MHQSLGVKVYSILLLVFLLFSNAVSNQLILSEDFENGQNGWNLYVDNVATAETWVMNEFGSKVMHTYVSNTGSENWHVHLRKDGFAVEKGKSYVVSVDLRTEDGYERNVELRVEKSTMPYTNYSDIAPFKITDELKTYTFNFTMEHDTDLQAGFCIEMGYFPADTDPLDVVVDNILITEVDNPVPVVGITSPSDGLITNTNPLPVTWVVNGFEQSTELFENLVEGLNKIVRTYTDSYGQTGNDSVNVTLDTRAPIVEIHLPLNGYMTNDTIIDVAWSIDGVVQDTLTTERLLKEGSNGVLRSAADAAGNVGMADIVVWRDTQDPDVKIISPEDGSFTNQSTIDIVWTMDGLTQINELTEDLVEGQNTIIRTFTEHVGNTGADTIVVTLDTQAPVVAITSPVNGYLTNNTSQTITWTVDGVAQTANLTESLVEGTNVITRSFTDAAGNVGTASITVTLDTQAPVVAITSPVDGLVTNANPLAIAWTIDGVAQTTDLSETLVEGANVITRSITDAAGNVGTANITVNLDTQAPVVAITSPLDGFVTNQTPITIAWTIDGVAQTTDLSEALVEGANVITRSITDAAGNVGTANIAVTLDTQAPLVAITSPTDGFVTNANPLTIAWTVDGVVQMTDLTETLVEGTNVIIRSITDAAGNIGIASITVSLDTQAPVVDITSPVDGLVTNETPITIAWTIDGVAQTTDLTEALVEGANVITRSITDAAGNAGTASITVTLDTQAPAVVITSPVDGFITNANPLAIAWTVDGVVQTTDLSETLVEGANVITRSITDAAGNMGTANIAVTLDTQAPVVVITSPVDGVVTNVNPLAIAWTVDGVVQTTDLSETLVEGTNVITRSITDAAGNTGTASITVNLDTQAPVVDIISPTEGYITNNSSISVSWTVDGVAQTTLLTEELIEGDNTITRSFTDAAGNIGSKSIIVKLDTQAPIVAITSPVDGLVTNQTPITIAWTVDGVDQTTDLTQELNEGINTITRSVSDGAGNIGTATISVELDTQVPVVEITSPVDGFVATSTPITVAWSIDGVLQTTDLSENLVVGNNTITRSYTDNAGNTGTSSIVVTYEVYEPSVEIISPANNEVVSGLDVGVEWKIDGVLQTSKLSETFDELGRYEIIRDFEGVDGNTYADTVFVYVGVDTLLSDQAVTLDSTNLDLDNKSIYLERASLNVIGSHQFNSIYTSLSFITVDSAVSVNDIILDTLSTLTHFPTDTVTEYALDLTARSVELRNSSKVDVSGRGYWGARRKEGGYELIDARTLGNVTEPRVSSLEYMGQIGGSYGSQGRNTDNPIEVPGDIYGNKFYPFELGSGGGITHGGLKTNRGGSGGGRVKITSSILELDTQCSILANGYPGQDHAAGGSGGAILLICDTIKGSNATISASEPLGWYAGGGRIAIYSNVNLPSGINVITGSEMPVGTYHFEYKSDSLEVIATVSDFVSYSPLETSIVVDGWSSNNDVIAYRIDTNNDKIWDTVSSEPFRYDVTFDSTGMHPVVIQIENATGTSKDRTYNFVVEDSSFYSSYEVAWGNGVDYQNGFTINGSSNVDSMHVYLNEVGNLKRVIGNTSTHEDIISSLNTNENVILVELFSGDSLTKKVLEIDCKPRLSTDFEPYSVVYPYNYVHTFGSTTKLNDDKYRKITYKTSDLGLDTSYLGEHCVGYSYNDLLEATTNQVVELPLNTECDRVEFGLHYNNHSSYSSTWIITRLSIMGQCDDSSWIELKTISHVDGLFDYRNVDIDLERIDKPIVKLRWEVSPIYDDSPHIIKRTGFYLGKIKLTKKDKNEHLNISYQFNDAVNLNKQVLLNSTGKQYQVYDTLVNNLRYTNITPYYQSEYIVIDNVNNGDLLSTSAYSIQIDSSFNTIQKDTVFTEGTFKIEKSINDEFGNVVYDSKFGIVDLTAPEIKMVSPKDGDTLYTNSGFVEIVFDVEGVIKKIDTVLQEGMHTIPLEAKDLAGHTGYYNVNFFTKNNSDNTNSSIDIVSPDIDCSSLTPYLSCHFHEGQNLDLNNISITLDGIEIKSLFSVTPDSAYVALGNSEKLDQGLHELIVTIDDIYGSKIVDSLEFTVNTPIAKGQVSDTLGYAPLRVTFSSDAEYLGKEVDWYRWDVNSDGEYDFSSQRQDLYTHEFESPGTYYAKFQVIGSDGVMDSSLFKIEVEATPPVKPIAKLEATKSTGLAPLSTRFYGSGTKKGGYIKTHEWDIDGDGIFETSYRLADDTVDLFTEDFEGDANNWEFESISGSRFTHVKVEGPRQITDSTWITSKVSTTDSRQKLQTPYFTYEYLKECSVSIGGHNSWSYNFIRIKNYPDSIIQNGGLPGGLENSSVIASLDTNLIDIEKDSLCISITAFRASWDPLAYVDSVLLWNGADTIINDGSVIKGRQTMVPEGSQWYRGTRPIPLSGNGNGWIGLDSLDYYYKNNSNCGIKSPVISIPSNVDKVEATLNVKYVLGYGDSIVIELLENDVILDTVFKKYQSEDYSEDTISFELTAYQGKSIYLNVQFTSDSTSIGQGFSLDDFRIFSITEPDIKVEKNYIDQVRIKDFQKGGDSTAWTKPSSYYHQISNLSGGQGVIDTWLESDFIKLDNKTNIIRLEYSKPYGWQLGRDVDNYGVDLLASTNGQDFIKVKGLDGTYKSSGESLTKTKEYDIEIPEYLAGDSVKFRLHFKTDNNDTTDEHFFYLYDYFKLYSEELSSYVEKTFSVSGEHSFNGFRVVDNEGLMDTASGTVFVVENEPIYISTYYDQSKEYIAPTYLRISAHWNNGDRKIQKAIWKANNIEDDIQVDSFTYKDGSVDSIFSINKNHIWEYDETHLLKAEFNYDLGGTYTPELLIVDDLGDTIHYPFELHITDTFPPVITGIATEGINKGRKTIIPEFDQKLIFGIRAKDSVYLRLTIEDMDGNEFNTIIDSTLFVRKAAELDFDGLWGNSFKCSDSISWDGTDVNGDTLSDGAYRAVLKYYEDGQWLDNPVKKGGEYLDYISTFVQNDNNLNRISPLMNIQGFGYIDIPFTMKMEVMIGGRGSGDRLRTLQSPKIMGAGRYKFFWDGLSGEGNVLSNMPHFFQETDFVMGQCANTVDENIFYIKRLAPEISQITITPNEFFPFNESYDSTGNVNKISVTYNIDKPAATVDCEIIDSRNSIVVWQGSWDNVNAGSHSFTWLGKDKEGNYLDQGVYKIRLKAKTGYSESMWRYGIVRILFNYHEAK